MHDISFHIPVNADTMQTMLSTSFSTILPVQVELVLEGSTALMV
jgi:hypothetical protein